MGQKVQEARSRANRLAAMKAESLPGLASKGFCAREMGQRRKAKIAKTGIASKFIMRSDGGYGKAEGLQAMLEGKNLHGQLHHADTGSA